jgi:hypothetical protein
MKARFGTVVPLCLLFAACTFTPAPTASAQDQPGGAAQTPSKYLYLTNEAVKPGMSDAHIKNESAEAQAARQANSPAHYIGMVSITGPSHALFLHSFDAFADLQKHHEEMMANAQFHEALKTGQAAETPLLESSMGSIYVRRSDLSLHPLGDISQVHFFEITLYHVRSGHHQDWERLAKLYMKALDSTPNAHWAMFEKMYGVSSDNAFIVVTGMKSLSEVDDEVMNEKNLPSTVGEAQLQMMRELGSTTIESSESDLFAVVPQMSYVPSGWDQSFWGQK